LSTRAEKSNELTLKGVQDTFGVFRTALRAPDFAIRVDHLAFHGEFIATFWAFEFYGRHIFLFLMFASIFIK